MENQNKIQGDFHKAIAEIVESQRENIKANVGEQIKKSVIDSLSWSLREHVSKVTNEFVENELKGEIMVILQDNKDVLLQELKTALTKISAQFAIAMYEQAAKLLD